MTIAIVEKGSALRAAVADVRARILQSPDIPPAKLVELERLWNVPPGWKIREARLRPGIAGRTDHDTHTVSINAAAIAAAATGGPDARARLRAIVFHELIHATGEHELDAEVLENLVYANAGATPPTVHDIGAVNRDGRLAQSPEGFTRPPVDPWAPVLGDHFVWDPRTGKVHRRGANGQPTGTPVLSGPDWRRPSIVPLASGNYRLGRFEFDPLHLRLSTIATPGRSAMPVVTSPHFVLALFAAIEADEAARPPRRGRPSILALRDATLTAPPERRSDRDPRAVSSRRGHRRAR